MSNSTSALNSERLANALASDVGTWHPPRVHDVLDSTNDELRRAADDHGRLNGGWLLAIADAQENGRGRMGHGWFSPPGSAIHLSIGGELQLAAPLWPRASLVVGAAVAEALTERTGVDVRLKWPNDLLVRYEGQWRKAGGILCERYERSGDGAGASEQPPLWIAGIGIDVSIEKSAFPEILRDHVASLSWLAAPANRTELALEIALKVRRHIERWQRRGGELDRDELRRRMVFIGDVVHLDHGNGQAAQQVRLMDLASDGGLVVQPLTGGTNMSVQPLQIVAAQSQPPWQAPPRLNR